MSCFEEERCISNILTTTQPVWQNVFMCTSGHMVHMLRCDEETTGSMATQYSPFPLHLGIGTRRLIVHCTLRRRVGCQTDIVEIDRSRVYSRRYNKTVNREICSLCLRVDRHKVLEATLIFNHALSLGQEQGQPHQPHPPTNHQSRTDLGDP